MINEEERCPSCQKTIPADAPMGVCPVCLLAATGDLADESRRANSFEVPTVGEVQAKFPQLEVLELIGRGGMGAVYKVCQRELDRIAALKILPPDIGEDPEFADRFAKEAKSLARLNHSNIVTLYEFGSADGLYFFLMEFVDGVNLRQAMNAARFTPDQALAVVPPVCEALQYAHDQGVVHRDIKPENLLLDKNGQIKIADFGIAKMITGPEAAETARQAGGDETVSLPMGTPSYMAPEQLSASAQIDHRVDVYAIGVVLYELLTGQKPQNGEFENPSQRVQVDVRIDEVVLRALERDPERRYATAQDFRTQIESVTTGKLNDPPEVPPANSDDWTAGNRQFSSLAMAAMILIAISFNLSATAWDWRVGTWIADIENISAPDLYILLLWPIGKLAPIATTIVAWLAIAQIRRSEERLDGLLISVIIALIYPLACINGAVSTMSVEALRVASDSPVEGTDWYLGAVSVFNLLVDGLVIWIVWRIAGRPAKISPASQKMAASIGLVATAFSGLLSLFSFLLGTNSATTLDAMLPASAIIGMSLGVLTWSTLTGKIAAGIGAFNLLLATLLSVLTLGQGTALDGNTRGDSNLANDKFGRTVIESLPSTNNLGQISFLDLDQGSRFAVASFTNLYGSPLRSWIEKSGADITATTLRTPFTPEPQPRLIGDACDTAFAFDDRRSFESIRAEHFDERIRRAINLNPQGTVEGYSPYWFRTTSGNTGVIQITKLETVPPTITFRYKLIGTTPVYHTNPGRYDPRGISYTTIAFILLMIWFRVLAPRFRMERTGAATLADHPDAERKSVRIVFTSLWAAEKEREVDQQIADMAAEGWTFVRLREDNPLRALTTIHGSARIDFVRQYSAETTR